jgi:hypothetical protein
MQSITKMQIQLMDRMMDAWEEQIKSPNPSALVSRLSSLPTFSGAGSLPNASFPMPALNPFEAYVQFAEQWRKAWATRQPCGPKPEGHRKGEQNSPLSWPCSFTHLRRTDEPNGRG